MHESELIYGGSAVKALNDSGKIGGYLVLFSSPKDPDLAKDFFTKSTDFNLEVNDKASVFYGHGMDPVLGKRKLGVAELKMDKVGVWAEAQLNLRDDYEKKVLELVKAGKLGWSSGTAPHLVEREEVKGSNYIKSWPILDASLTPMPCEPRTLAMTVKDAGDLLVSIDDAYKAVVMANEKRDILAKAIKDQHGAGMRMLDHDDKHCYCKWDGGSYMGMPVDESGDDSNDYYLDYEIGQHYAQPYKMRADAVKFHAPHFRVRQFTGYAPMDGDHFDAAGLGNEGKSIEAAESTDIESAPPTGMPLKSHIDTALTAVDDLVIRITDYAELRTSQGRAPIGTERMQQIKSLTSALDRLTSLTRANQEPEIDLEAKRRELDAMTTWLEGI